MAADEIQEGTHKSVSATPMRDTLSPINRTYKGVCHTLTLLHSTRDIFYGSI
jgi:hypothetical protein